ncbi:MAG: ketopantoate reductase family protein [Halioglobus sp.]
MPEPRWHILGAGAIGCLVASALSRAGGQATVLVRPGEVTGPRTLIVDHEGRQSRELVDTQTAQGAGVIKNLLVTTKAYDALDAIASIGSRLADGCTIMLLLNGMGIAEQVAEAHPTAQLLAGTTTEGAYRVAPLHIEHAGRGETRIGYLGPGGKESTSHRSREAPDWFDVWQDSQLACDWDADIEAALWSKLAINCVINPLTALHRCRNGELSTRPALADEVALLCREVQQVSYAAGFTKTAQELERIVASVIERTAQNRSSMLEDVERARPTEIDYITGYLLQVADRHGIVAPRNRELYGRIRDLV